MRKNKDVIKTSILKIFLFTALTLTLGFICGKLIYDHPIQNDICQVSDNGEYCFEDDPTYYVAEGLDYIPSGSFGSDVCYANNPGVSSCHIVSICPNCVNEKIECVCRK